MRKVLNVSLATIVAFWSLLLIPAAPAFAAADTCTWDGSTSGDWSDGTNWTGCDNSGVPETGDTLVFPTGTSNTTMNNDLAIVADNVTFNSATTYIVNGNTLELSGSLATSGSITYNSQVKFSDTTGYSQLSIPAGTPTFNAGIDLNLTATASFIISTTNFSVDLPVITGTTNEFNVWGNPTDPKEVYNSSTSASSFSATAINIWWAGFNCRSNNCLGLDANPIYLGGSDVPGTFLRLNSAGMTLANPITFDDTGVLVGPSILEVVEDATTTGTITVSDNATISVAATKSLLLNGSVSITGASNTLTYTVAAGGQVTHNGSVSGAGNIVANGYVQMINANTYTGTTTVNSGGILIISNAGGLGTTAGATTVNSGGTLQFNLFAAGSTAEDITVSGTGRVGSTGALEVYNLTNDATLTGNVTLAGDTTIGQGLSGTASFNFDGVISGTGDITIGGFNTSAFRFGGTSANTYVGNVTMTGGQLYLSKTAGVTAITGDATANGSPAANSAINVGADSQIDDAANIVLNTDTGLGILVMSGGTSEVVGAISGDGDVSLSAGSSLTTLSPDDYELSGRIYKSSAGATPEFVKDGSGKLTIAGTLTDGGAGFPIVFANGGTLLMQSDFTNADFTMNGGTLGGTGTVGDTTGNIGAFSPGTSPGCITVSGDFTMNSGATFTEEIASGTACSGFDQTTVTGVNGLITLNNPTLNVVLSYTPAPGTQFTILQSLNNSLTGQFNGLPDGSSFNANGVDFRINYINEPGGESSRVVLTVLGGTLASTGQSANWVNLLAIMLLISSGAGLMLVAWQKRKLHLSR